MITEARTERNGRQIIDRTKLSKPHIYKVPRTKKWMCVSKEVYNQTATTPVFAYRAYKRAVKWYNRRPYRF